MSRSFPLLLCSLALTVVPALAAPLAGLIDGDTYVSPTGQFRVRSPILTELGGVITDTPNVVTFQDNYGIHVSIACFELDATQRWEYDTRGQRDYLLYFLTDHLMGNFTTRFPGSRIESARYLPELLDGALIGYVLLPGGSEFERHNRVTDSLPVEPVTAKRGTLLFVRHRYIYAISVELSERATQRSTYKLTREQEDELLSTRLITLSGRLSFTNDRPRTP